MIQLLFPKPAITPAPVCYNCGLASHTVSFEFGHNLCAACVYEIDRDLETLAEAKRREIRVHHFDCIAEHRFEGRILRLT